MKETISRLPLVLLLLGMILFGVTVTHSQEVAAQIGPSTAPIPGNDDLVNATVVPGLPYNDAISYVAPESATGEPNEAICGNQQGGIGFTASAWYKYTAAQSGVLNVTITPLNGTTDVSLAIYTGPTDNPTHPLTDNLGCRDVAGAGQAENLAAGVSAGTTYYVRVATLGDSGDYRVDMIDSVSVFLPLVIKSPPSDSWQTQDSTVEVELNAIDCPTTTFCVAVGVNGVVVTTTDGGSTWDGQTSGTAFALNDVSCRDANNCVAVGDSGRIIRTGDGGSSWVNEDSGTSQILRGVGCATDTCFAVGGTGTSTGVVSFDGGDGWVTPPDSLGNTDLYGASCPNDGTCTVVGRFGRVLVFAGTGVKDGPFNLGKDLRDVDCATDSFCLTVGVAGEIQKTGNGGSSWTPRTSGTAQVLEGVSCPDAQTCYAAGDGGTVITSANGGENWEPETTNVTINLNDVSCPDSTTCYAVGASGTILGRK